MTIPVTFWASHFQAISASRAITATASFGSLREDSQLGSDGLSSFTPDQTKKFAIPTVVGIAAAVIAKTAGVAGAAPILIGGLGAIGTFIAVQAMERKGESKDLGTVSPPAILTPLPQTVPPPRTAATPQPFIGPIQQTPAAVPTTPVKPWRVIAALSPNNAILSAADVQNALNTLGFATPYLTVDGKSGLGTLTALAVKRAQAKYRLPQTGSTTDANLKVALQDAMNSKAMNDKAATDADALAKSMGVT